MSTRAHTRPGVVVLQVAEQRVVDGVPQEEDHLRRLEPRLRDVEALRVDLHVVEVEYGVHQSRCQTGGRVGERLGVQCHRRGVGSLGT